MPCPAPIADPAGSLDGHWFQSASEAYKRLGTPGLSGCMH